LTAICTVYVCLRLSPDFS